MVIWKAKRKNERKCQGDSYRNRLWWGEVDETGWGAHPLVKFGTISVGPLGVAATRLLV